MRVVIASQDGKNVNGHFGSASTFMIYNISGNVYELINQVFFGDGNETESCSQFKGNNEDRLSNRLQAIEGSKVVFVAAIGGTASARVIRKNVYPVKIDPPEPIDKVLVRMQAMLNGNPPIWLRRIMNNESAKD